MRARGNAEKKKLNKRLIRRTLRGYRVMNKITQAERREWLSEMTMEEARRIFDDLNQLGDRWREHGGDLKALERRRVESKIEGRRTFLEIARRHQIIEGADG